MSSKARDVFGDFPSRLRIELTELITKRLRGELSSEDAERLSTLILSDEIACEHYIRVGFETAVLVRYASQWCSRHKGVLDQLIGFEHANSSDVLIDTESKAGWPETKTRLLPGLHAAAASTRGSGLLPTRSLAFFGAATVIAMACWLVLGAWALPKGRAIRPLAHDESPASGTMDAKLSVASLVAQHDCRWHTILGQAPTLGTTFTSGTTLELESGSAGFKFADGTQVVFQGPARFEARDKSRVYLAAGRLAAHVPPRAVGFEVETPTARVVDLGTDFRLEVSPQETKIAVIAGKVDLFPVSAAADGRKRAAASRRVTAGQAVTIAAKANKIPVVQEVKFDAQWLSSVARTLPNHRSPSTAVAYQISESAAGNQRDFHGSVGLDFEVRVPIRVFSLGVFDHLGDGIDPATSPTVQLWSRDTSGTPSDARDDVGREILTSQTFRAGDPDKLKSGHRFKSLPKPIDLPIGFYSIVAYGLSDANPFITFGDSDPDVDFSSDPGWTGSGNTAGGNSYGWRPGTNHAGGKKGEVGGTFAQSRGESFYGDTALNQKFTLSDAISASGDLNLSNAESMHGKFFVGHYSSSTANNRREFIGAEFIEGDTDGWVGMRARIYRFNGEGVSDAYSNYVNLVSVNGPYHFDYQYDPNYEADDSHAGPEGRLTLHVYDGLHILDATLYAINDASHRDAGSTFDSFGMGISTMESTGGDDPTSTARLFMDDLTYSGIRGNSSQASMTQSRSAAQVWFESWHKSIVSVGSRLEECEPGTFPRMASDRNVRYGAGSFEFCPQREEASSKR
jgi:hypothetical protein